MTSTLLDGAESQRSDEQSERSTRVDFGRLRDFGANASASASASGTTGQDDACQQQQQQDLETERIVRLSKRTTPGVHHVVEQNTPKWYHIRRGDLGVRVGASEAPVIVGLSPYSEPRELMEQLIAQEDGTWKGDDTQSAPTVHGHACEPMISDMYEYFTNTVVSDGGYWQHPDARLGVLYGASPDRLIIGAEGKPIGIVEIKAPFGIMYAYVKDENVAQMQFQMWCSGFEYCDYVAVKLDHDTPADTQPRDMQVLLARVYRSEEYIQWMIPRLALFSICLGRRTRLPDDLYATPDMGKEIPPQPRIVQTFIAPGEWVVQKCARCKSLFHVVGRSGRDAELCVACDAQ